MLRTALILLILAAIPLQAAALETQDLLALVAMPLAVAAVADVTGIPVMELASVAATLNNANVAPVEFIEVMRYVPVALVVDAPDQPEFYQFVDSRYDLGITGAALVNEIEDQFPIYGIPRGDVDVDVVDLRPARVIERTWFPPIVQTRITERSSHPHGGPPGQLKKELGLKTGAEVVHGSSRTQGLRDRDRRDDDDRRRPRAVRVDRDRSDVARIDRDDDRRGRSRAMKMEKPGKGRGRGNDEARGGGRSNGKGHGKGNGNGKGKN